MGPTSKGRKGIKEVRGLHMMCGETNGGDGLLIRLKENGPISEGDGSEGREERGNGKGGGNCSSQCE